MRSENSQENTCLEVLLQSNPNNLGIEDLAIPSHEKIKKKKTKEKWKEMEDSALEALQRVLCSQIASNKLEQPNEASLHTFST